MDYTKINGAERRLLQVIQHSPKPIIAFYTETSMTRTECYDRLNGLMAKGLVIKKNWGIKPNEVTVFCLTDDGLHTLENIDKEQTKLK